MITHYFSNNYFRKFIVGFANVFAGLRVRTGMDGCGNITELEVPIRYGSNDRVVAMLGSSNTQNKLHTLPMMSCYLTGVELAPDRMHGVNQVDRRSYLEQGGVFPDDVKVMKRVMAIPYNMQMELSIYASNTDQLYQILEQILILFDYQLQLQFSDAPFDWAKITSLELINISNEEVYPAGTERRMLVWTLSFNMPIWLSPPIEIRREIIKAISIRIGDLDHLTLAEVDENGNLVPFNNPYVWDQTPVTGVGNSQEPPNPDYPPYEPPHYNASLDKNGCGPPQTHEP